VRTANRGTRKGDARRAALVGVLLGDALVFGLVVNRYYPISQWLFWRYATSVSLTVFFALSCIAGGDALLLRILGRSLPLREHLVLAFPAGVFLFQLGIFLAGLAGLLTAPLFVALPSVMLAVGGRRFVTRAVSFVRRTHRRRRGLELGPALLGAAGVFAVGLLYFQILSPQLIGYDARWYHLPLAEHYAADGAIRPTPEGWWLSAYPQLASHLYTWAFLLPRAATFDKTELSLHLEFASFVGMLAAIPVAVRKLVPRTSARGTWALYFLFPQVLLYDSNLNGGADHIAALFSLPLGISALRAGKSLHPRECAVFAIMAAGVILTKYSAYSVLFAPFLAITLRSLWLFVRGSAGQSRSRLLRGPLLALGLGLLLTTPLWLKNWVFYRDPFYPLLRGHFRSELWFPEAERTWAQLMGNLAPARPGWAGLKDAARATLLFPFEVHDWKVFHRDVPIFGPWFTLTLPCLPFLRAGKRLWIVYGSALSAVFLWFLPCHYERYLQVVVPWMVSGTAATLILLYRKGLATRLALLPLLLLTVVWGGDVYFFPTDNIVGDSPVRAVSTFLASGFSQTRNRLIVSSPFEEVGRALPKRGARLLVHQLPIHLGIGVPSVQDLWQGGISYGRLVTPQAIHAALRRMGVTHLLWTTAQSEGHDSLGSDLAFYSFVTRFGEAPASFGNLTLARMPASVPKTFDDRVLFLGCRGPYQPGLYYLGDMNDPPGQEPFKRLSGDSKGMLPEAAFVIFEPGCPSPPSKDDLARFRLLFRRGNFEFYGLD
jgi:hypothetical protein